MPTYMSLSPSPSLRLCLSVSLFVTPPVSLSLCTYVCTYNTCIKYICIHMYYV